MTIRQIQVGKAAHRHIHPPKTRSGARTIALSDFLVGILRTHHTTQEADWEKTHPNQRMSEWVFQAPSGTWLDGDQTRKMFKRLLRKAGLSETTRIHDLRHAMATTWLSQGIAVKVVSERLGHASIAITLPLHACAPGHATCRREPNGCLAYGRHRR